MMPPNTRVEISHWRGLMEVFELPSCDDIYHLLRAAYLEKHRAYHTLDHIDACLKHLDIVGKQAQRAHEIELALWFHDAIYKPFSSTNEEDSAEMAKAFMLDNNVVSDAIERIYDLIILTKDHIAPETNDAKLMLDIDLSILGTERRIYEQFEKDVRKEYKRVPSFIFKKKRRDILVSFLERPQIYYTEYFADALEMKARDNLAWAIKRL